MKHGEQSNCPVCGMAVDRRQYEIVYQQMHFAFCSVHCKARFLAHPHLYIGYPGRAAPKQEGQAVFKQRRLHLQAPLSAEGQVLVEALLRGLTGVTAVTVAEDAIAVSYDLLQVDLAEIETALTEAGARLGGGWTERLRRAWIHESEEAEIEAREAAPPHHYLP